MLSQGEKKQIKELHQKEEELSGELKSKLIQSIRNGEPSIFEEAGAYLCCDLGIDQPERYQSMDNI